VKTSVRARPLRRWAQVLSAAVVGAAAFASALSAAGAATAGPAVIVNGATGFPLNSGGPATTFGVNLPAGARCPGDSRHLSFKVFTYMLPQGADVSAATYTNVPAENNIGLFAGGQYVGPINTEPDTGVVPQMPGNLSFSPPLQRSDLIPQGQTSATWDAGVACVDRFGHTASYWNVALVFLASHAGPAGFTWRTAHHVAGPSSTRRTLTVVAAGVIGAALAYFVVTQARRLRRRGAERGRAETEDGARPEMADATREPA